MPSGCPLLVGALLCVVVQAAGAAALRPATIPNFRDVGGAAAKTEGRIVRTGLLHRSASPANASVSEAGAVTDELGIRVVLDLRGEKDAAKDVGPRLLQPKTRYLPLLTENMMRSALVQRAKEQGIRSFLKLLALSLGKKLSPSRRLRSKLSGALDIRLAGLLDLVSLTDLYWLICSERGDMLKQALEMCATGEALPLLVHCTHGKDRTGVLVALILAACGVDEDEIVRDYARSHEYGCSVEGRWAMRQALPATVRDKVDQTVLDDWCEAPDEVIKTLFEQLRAEYGSVVGYFESIGVDKSLRDRLVHQLTVPAA